MEWSPAHGAAAVIISALSALACGSAAAYSNESSPNASGTAVVPVVASTNVYGNIAEEIGGDKVDVVSIINDPAQDPHSYEASTQDQLAMSKAEVVIENGGGYDDFVDKMLSSSESSPDVINAVEVSGMNTDADGFNEHVWYDFPTMGKLADRMADVLARTAPAEADVFKQNATAFKEKLTVLEDKEGRIEQDYGGTAVAVTEPVPLYMIEASGLRNSTPAEFSEAIEEGDDVPARSLQEMLALFTDQEVEALVYNEQTAGPQTERVKQAAEGNGVPVVPVTETLPEGENYIGWMTANVDALQSALDS